eukprot:GHVL01004616.1.p1 GENE.GHVL01004616.1~~GHVL01004616.1.p1  ORF type:complete len:315 (+),score=39.84 GHVL01004616.1:74-1018(+)
MTVFDILVCGGCDGRRTFQSVKKISLCGERKDITDSESKSHSTDEAALDFSAMTTERCALGACTTESGRVYACGGHDGKGYLKTAECLGSSSWTTMPNLHYPRAFHCCSSVGERVFVAGGHTDTVVLRTVEMYDPILNNWRALSPMIESRHSCCSAVVGTCLYIAGGRDGLFDTGRVHKTIEVSDTNALYAQWNIAATMKQARVGATAVTFNGKIYIIGGSNGVKPLSSTEVFDPQLGVLTPGPSLNYPRNRLCGVVYEGKIYVIGGRDDCRDANNTEDDNGDVEVLIDNTWKIVKHLKLLRNLQKYAVVVVSH